VNLIDEISMRSFYVNVRLVIYLREAVFAEAGDLTSDCTVPVKDGTEYVE
jgi:hypothetical protein